MKTPDASAPLNDRTLLGIAVIIAVWGDTAGLDDCLAALEPQRDDNISVIVVASRVSLTLSLAGRLMQTERSTLVWLAALAGAALAVLVVSIARHSGVLG